MVYVYLRMPTQASAGAKLYSGAAGSLAWLEEEVPMFHLLFAAGGEARSYSLAQVVLEITVTQPGWCQARGNLGVLTSWALGLQVWTIIVASEGEVRHRELMKPQLGKSRVARLITCEDGGFRLHSRFCESWSPREKEVPSISY